MTPAAMNQMNQIPQTANIAGKSSLPHLQTHPSAKSASASMDTISLRQSSTTHSTYSSSLSVTETADKSYEMLRKLVTTMLKEQGIDAVVATGDTTMDIGEISQEEAQELVAEDGYFGVAQTSDRIVDFAIGAAGGDPARLEAIKEGVEKGFNEALEAFGGALPDISYDTYDAVMEKLDAWADEATVKA